LQSSARFGAFAGLKGLSADVAHDLILICHIFLFDNSTISVVTDADYNYYPMA